MRNSSHTTPSADPKRPLSAFDVIFTRRSIRSYTGETIDADAVRALLDAAVQAPTAMHSEPWLFVVIQDAAVLKRYSDQAKASWLNELTSQADLHRPRGGDARRFREHLRDPAFSVFQDEVGRLLRRDSNRVDPYLWRFRLLIRRVETSEVLELTSTSLFVQTLCEVVSRSPRLTSRSSVRVTVTDCPATAPAASRSPTITRARYVSLPDGRIRMRSPTRAVPLTMVPARPRKSACGRLTTLAFGTIQRKCGRRPAPSPDAPKALDRCTRSSCQRF
jgi:nitroreductase